MWHEITIPITYPDHPGVLKHIYLDNWNLKNTLKNDLHKDLSWLSTLSYNSNKQ